MQQLDNNEKIIDSFEGVKSYDKQNWQYWAIGILGFAWSLYQIYVVFFPSNGVFVRAIHLSFALSLGFLIYSFKYKPDTNLLVKVLSYLMVLVGFFSAIASLYIYIFYNELALRAGAYTLLDVSVALFVTVMVIEATRRSIGLALPLVVIVFLIYDYFGPYMPDLIAHKGASLNKIAGQMYLTTEGILGVPLGVSATFVYLFVLFGVLLDKAGAGKYFIDLAFAALGRYRGGPAKASVLASGLTGIISGSSIANTVTTGTFSIPLMKKLGMPGYKAAAVEVAASTNGQLMPPIMGAAAFIIAEFLGMSYADVILTAFIPAFASYFALFFIVHLEAIKLGLKGEDKSRLPRFFQTFIGGLHYLVPIIFLIYTLLILRESPQSAVINAMMFLMLIIVFQGPVKALIFKQKITSQILLSGFTQIGEAMIKGAKNMVPIALATAAAGIIVGSITLTGIGQILIEVIEVLSSGNVLIMLILTAVVCLILGMGLPTTANYIIMASLTAPIIIVLAADGGFLIPTIAAHLFVFYFGILADDTPPVGIAAYAAAGIAKSPPIKTGVQGFMYDIRTAILPFAFFFNNKLLLIEGVDAKNPNDPNLWQWVTNPFEIGLIFITAVLGMFCFSSAAQGYFLAKLNILTRLLLLGLTFLFLTPNLANKIFAIGEYNYYIIAVIIYALIFMQQRIFVKKYAEV